MGRLARRTFNGSPTIALPGTGSDPTLLRMRAAFLVSFLVISAALLGGEGKVTGANAPAPDQAFAIKLVSALVDADYNAFVADGNDQFRGMPKGQFDAVAKRTAAVLKPGYELAYLGSLNQRGFLVTLWRISPKSSGDDLLATLSTRNGKVGGFFIR